MSKKEPSVVSQIVQAILLLSGIVLVIMKATGHIDWSWWIVLIPLYIYLIPFAIVFCIFLFLGVFALLALPFIFLGLVKDNK